MKSFALSFFIFLVVALSISTITCSVTPAQDATNAIKNAVNFLTTDVDSLPVRGIPGPIVPFGANSFPVVLAPYGDSTLAPVVSAAFVGKGRLLAFGHTDYCDSRAIGASESSKKFFSNALLWTSSNEEVTPEHVRVAVWQSKATADYLRTVGFDAFPINDIDKEFDVLVAGAVALNDKQYDLLFEKIRNGAGFITCGLGWGWSQLNPDKDLVFDHNGNRNLAANNVSLAWTDGTLSQTSEGAFTVRPEIVQKNHFASGVNVLKFIQRQAEDVTLIQKELEQIGKDDIRQFSATLALMLPYLPSNEVTNIDNFIGRFSNAVVPSEQNPISDDDLIERIIATVQTERYLHGQIVGATKLEDIPALPAALDFPGAVPEDAPRMNNVTIPVKTATPDWTSTGLYAAPGEIVTVKVNSDVLSKTTKPFKIRIGVHSDSIRHLRNWTRYPEISIEKTIRAPETKIVNPFGGLIYIVVPYDIGSLGLGIVDFQISGAISAPFFIRDATSLEEWKSLRHNPAPWAEFQGRNVIVSVPSSVVRKLDNPQVLLETWDRILDLEAEFASGPYVRERPERITCDREISAGYMHSGYPVMTHMDVEKVLVDADRLRTEGDWGFYHEFGHNHQSPYWTFEGTTEVTVNYFTLYIMEKFNGKSAEIAKGDLTKKAQATKMRAYFDNGAKFSDWKNDPFLALIMTIQMREKFGWEPFIRSVNEYTKAPSEELPKNDQEKRDQWMVRLSRNSGLNLGPFFTIWGIPISKEALDSVKELPEWIPEEIKR